MNHPVKPIEEYFLESLLKICLISIVIVIAVDFYFTRFFVTRSLVVNGAVLFAIVTSFLLYKYGYFVFAVLWIGVLIVSAMFYQSIESESITTSSMAVVMVVGFGYSVLLKKMMPMVLHVITLLGMVAEFAWLATHPMRYGKPDASDIIVAGITYCVLYTVIAYSSWRLKQRYDEAFSQLERNNLELAEKAHEIETQNEELVQSQENLSQMNTHLESMVDARTQEVKNQNERLIRYAYSNAHHVRGPVARALGIIQLSKLETNLVYPFLFQLLEKEVVDIDVVVKGINRELEQ